MPHDVTAPAVAGLRREEIISRLAAPPLLDSLLTADDLERQKLAGGEPPRPAAVLLLIVNRPGEPTVVFTQRTLHLANHAGQISFPGGGCCDDDRTPERTALREAE